MWFQLANQFQRRRSILLCLTNQVLELSLVAILFHLWEQNMYFCRGLSIHHDCIQCSLVPISHVFSENIFFCIWSIRNLILPWWPFCLTDQKQSAVFFTRTFHISYLKSFILLGHRCSCQEDLLLYLTNQKFQLPLTYMLIG